MSPQARHTRIRHIRKRTVAASLAIFAAAWAAIFGQLATGHDPALAKSSQTQATSTPAATDSSSSLEPEDELQQQDQLQQQSEPMVTRQS